MASPDRLRNLLIALLDSAEGWLPTIDRTFVSAGRPVPECEALTVWLETINALGSAKNGCSIEPKATFHVTLYQCAESTSDAGSLNDEALRLADQAWALWTGCLASWKDGTLFGEDASVACSSIDLTRGMIVVDPSVDGIGGWDLTIVVSL